MRRSALALACAALSGCAGGSAIIPQASAPPAAKPETGFRQPQVQRETGLDSIIGKRADALTARFGKTRIDLKEGDARKLQFAGPNCVLDIYLYPLEEGAVPVATHVEARRREGGAPIEKQACLDEISRR